MVSSDFRAEARKKLEGKWGKAVCISLAYAAIFFVLSFIEGLFSDTMKSLVSLISIIIEIPLSFGLMFSLLKLYNGEDIKIFDFCSLGFSNFVKSWIITFRIFLKMIVPIILIIISYIIIAFGIAMTMSASIFNYAYTSTSSNSAFPFISIIGLILLFVFMIWAITKSYYYQLAYLIAIDNNNMTAKEAVEKSQELMSGNRSKLFVLQLSFIGWAILSVITFGIGYLWLIPYIQFATIAFYKFLNNSASSIKNDEISENTDPIQEQ